MGARASQASDLQRTGSANVLRPVKLAAAVSRQLAEDMVRAWTSLNHRGKPRDAVTPLPLRWHELKWRCLSFQGPCLAQRHPTIPTPPDPDIARIPHQHPSRAPACRSPAHQHDISHLRPVTPLVYIALLAPRLDGVTTSAPPF